MMKAIFSGIVVLSLAFSFAQSSRQIQTTFKNSDLLIASPLEKQYIWAESFKLFDLSFNNLNLELNGDDIPHIENSNAQKQVVISIPNPDGGTDLFRVFRNNTMHPDLQTSFPEIRTFDVIGLENRLLHGKIDITPHGFHAMIFGKENGIYFIDPVQQQNNKLYMVYYKKDFVTNKVTVCNHDHEVHSVVSNVISNGDIVEQLSYSSCQKRTYRLALAATAEYTTFHGGTVALAQAAQVTTMNRVNGVYEKEIAITMQIIGNNQLLIYTNASTDPYTATDDGAMLDQNITNCNSVIGSSNYDIGHVFSQGGNSGVAYKGVICNNTYKGGGVTGNAAPQGDPFDIDYVAHEMGHQFGADHTQNNNCNRNNATAVEPGSASTILGYAGICSPNVQNNSDAYFHGISLGQIGSHISGTGGACAVVTNLSNQAPSISATNGGVTIPISTPFALTATASDPNGDVLYYRWEQTNNQTSTQPPVATSTSGPNFRSFASTTSPTRYFPNLQAVANNGSFTWERLPSVARTMNFRVTVHDNHAVAGCSDYVNTTVTFDATAGPFVLTVPSATGISWQALSTQTVTWNVANTTNSNVNCQFVNIYLSTNGGTSYPTVLATNVPNNGSASITVPNLPNTTSRVMVQASNGTFFDVSDNNFTITNPVNSYTLVANTTTATTCAGTNATFNFTIEKIGNYINPVTLSVSGLPSGASASWSTNPVTPQGTTTLTVVTNGVTQGTYTLNINATSAIGPQSVNVSLAVNNAPSAAVSLTSPANNAVGISSSATLTWSASSATDVTYQIDIASNSDFSNMIQTQNGVATTSFTSSQLGAGQTYYWRVRPINSCGNGPFSSVRSFTTDNCQLYNSTNVPIAISASGTPTINSTLNITQSGTINNITVQNLAGTHTYISDLVVRLISPQGTQVVLFNGICGSQDNFNLNFSDAASSSTIPCPATTGLTYKPSGTLASFNGQQMQGTWTLQIQDLYNQDGGQLQSWGINICYTCTEVTPTFAQVGPYCSGAAIPALPTTSQNGISGTWSPALNNTSTTTYTFTPTAGQCATTATMNVSITPVPTQPTLACYQTANFNSATCQWEVTGTQPNQPTLACYESASFNTTTCQWEISGSQPNQPTLACYQTANFNTTTCQWEVTGTQPNQPTLACYQTANFNSATCQWEVTGSQPNQPTLACYESANFNTTTCQWEISGSQPNQPTLACYQTANFNTTTCQWEISGSQPNQPTLACYQTANFNTTTCQWEVTGSQPNQPTLACYESANFNTTTCQWEISGSQPNQPTLACYQTANFNSATCQWEVTGSQPNQPSNTVEYVVPSLSAFYSGPFIGSNAVSTNPIGWSWNLALSNEPTLDASGNAGRMNLVGHYVQIDLGSATPSSVSYFLQNIGSGSKTILVQYSNNGSTWVTAETHTQVNLPLNVTTFYENVIPNDAKHIRFILTVRSSGRIVIDGITVNGTGSNVTQSLACYENYTFNTATCQWEISGSQPNQPTLACYETANFNTTTCQWEVTGSQPNQPTLACYETANFNTTTCQWEISGSQPNQPTLACYETANFNSATCQWEVTGSQPNQPTLACYESASFNTTTCQWEVTGSQPNQPTLACYESASFNSTTCQWEVSGSQPNQPTLACYESSSFNSATCQWEISGSQPNQPTLACYETANFNSATCQWEVTGSQPNQPTLACYESASFNTATCQWEISGTPPQPNIQVIGSCSPIVWIDGNTYSSSNYSASLLLPGADQNGCDSLIMLHLTITPCTQLDLASCGASAVAMSTTIRANNIIGALAYRFRIIGPNNGSTGWNGNEYILDRPTRSFMVSQIPGTIFGSTYQIDVAVSMDGVNFGGYGNVCSITLSSTPTTQLEALNCGSTNVSVGTNIRAIAVSGAAGYRFKISGNNTGAVGWNLDEYFLDRATRDFKFNMVPGIIWGETYSVEVAVMANDGTYGAFGNLCSVTLESPITTLDLTSCGLSGASLSTTIRANNITGATGYRFRITGANSIGWSNDQFILDRPSRDFKFNMVPGVLAGQTYSVEVALLFQDGQTYGSFGTICTVTLSNTLMQEISETINTVSILEVLASHNPFTNDFGLQVITNQDDEPLLITLYDLTGKILEQHSIYPLDIDVIRFGGKLSSGLYMIEIRQSHKKVSLRQVKS